MNKRAFIAGKISGLSKGYVRDKFNQVANKLSRLGYQVIKPGAITEETQPWNDVVLNDIKRMIECDEVHLLPDWQESRWIQFERDVAIRMGMQIIYH